MKHAQLAVLALASGLLVLALLMGEFLGGDDPVGGLEGSPEAQASRPTEDAGGQVLSSAPTRQEPGEGARQALPAAPESSPAEDVPPQEQGPTRYEFGDEHLDIRVVEPDGSPVKKVDVWVFGNGINVLELASFAILRLESEDGHYRIEGLSRGLWNVVVEDLPLRCSSLADTERAHPVPHPGPPPVFVMVPPGEMTGTVRDGAGTPVEADLHLGSAVLGKLLHPGEQSDEESGEYGFELLAPGLYQVWAESDLGESVVREVEVASKRVTIKVDHVVPTGAWIDLVVLDADGVPLHGAEALLLNDSDDVDHREDADGEGRASFGPLSPGRWTVMALVDEERDVILSEVVNLTAGERRVVELQARNDGILVTGTIEPRVEESSSLQLIFLREGGSLGEGLSITQVTDDSRFEIVLPGPGSYQVRGDRGRMVDRVVVPDEPSWEVHLALPTGSVAGRLLLPEGGVGFWTVTLQREDRHLDGALPGMDQDGAPTNAARFRIDGVRPGRYRLLATPGDSGTQGWFAEPVTGIEVLAGQAVEGVTVSVTPAASLVVKLLRPDGGQAPIDGATLRAHTPGGMTLTHRPDAQGTTLLQPLPRGVVLVSAQTQDEFASKQVLIQPAPPPGEPEQPAEVELVLARGGFITLRSERGGEPASAGLRLFGEGGLEVTDLTGTGRPGFQDLISSSERRFGPLAPGSYEATALSPDGLSARATTQVEAGEESVVVIRFD